MRLIYSHLLVGGKPKSLLGVLIYYFPCYPAVTSSLEFSCKPSVHYFGISRAYIHCMIVGRSVHAIGYFFPCYPAVIRFLQAYLIAAVCIMAACEKDFRILRMCSEAHQVICCLSYPE